MMRTIWKQPERYESYFRIPGWYVTGDSAYKDPDGYFWFQGRVDDLIITAGENVGPFEVESCLVEHPAVAEAGVIGKPDVMRGHIIKAFISLREGYVPSDELKDEIQKVCAAKAGGPRRAARNRIPRKTPQNPKRQNHAPRAESMGTRPAHRRPFHPGGLNVLVPAMRRAAAGPPF